MERPQLYPNDNASSNTILIVDDDMINRKILGKIFSGYYKVEEAENGRVGIGRLMDGRSRFCAILLDVLMPEMTGIEVLRWMKERDLLEKIPVFLITSERSEDIVREAYQLGVMDVIQKPVISYVILRRVRSVIELFEARKHLSTVVEHQSVALLEQAEKIIQLNQGMIEALATAIEFRNEESGGHVQRICQITRILLEQTDFGDGLSRDEVENIALASILHDVGKIGVEDKILNKPGRLDEDEFEKMKQHTVHGYKMLANIRQLKNLPFYEYARTIALYHHERWDGRGYPDGLKGDEIPISAQIVALADVYDALTSPRVYKPAIPHDKAVEMIKTIVTDFEEGQIFKGTVVSIKEFGAFVEFAPGKEGMVHISKIARERINHVEDVLTLGDKVTVVCLGKDKMGRMSFSMKDVAQV